MKKVNWLLLICFTLCAFVMSCKNAEQPKMETVTLRQEWFPYVGYVGEVVAADLFAKDEGIALKVVAGAEDIDPIKMVLSGSETFGVVSADRIIMARAKGADVVAIGVINLKSSTCFLTKAESNITSPQDFLGKKVGILTGTNTEYVYKLLMKKMGVDRKKIKEMEIPFDLGTFVLGQYDVRPAFIYDEPISLDEKNIKYNIIDPTKYGISFIGTVYFTTGKTLKEKPEVVQKFINALIKGWDYSLKNDDKAMNSLASYDSKLRKERELNALRKGKEYYAGKNGKILFSDREDWERQINYLVELDVLKKDQSVKVDDVFTNKFVEAYYSKK